MTVQEWIVAIIVLLCAIVVGRRVWRFFRQAKNNDNPCANCISECDLKRMMDDKQQNCKKNLKTDNKKCAR